MMQKFAKSVCVNSPSLGENNFCATGFSTIKRYLKTGFIPDPYIECEKKKTLKLKQDK